MSEQTYSGHTPAEIRSAAESMRGRKIEEARRVGEDEICEFGTEHDGEWYPLGTVDGQTYTSNPADDLVIAKYITTANPPTILALLDRIDWLELRLQEALHREHNLLANTAALMSQRDQSLTALEAIADPRQTASHGEPTALRNYARAAIATVKGTA